MGQLQHCIEQSPAESSYVQSLGWYRHVIEYLPEPVLILIDGKVIYINKFGRELGETLFNEKNFIGKPILEMIPVRFHELINERVQNMRITGERVESVDIQIEGKTGTVLDVLLSAYPIHFEDVKAVLVVYRDITNIKKLERAIKESEIRYKSLIELNIDAVYSLDLRGNFVTLNPVCIEIGGFSEEELKGRSFKEIVVSVSLIDASEAFEQALVGKATQIELSIHHKHGRKVDLSASFIPIMVDSSVVGVYWVAKDVIEQKLIEKSLREANEALVNISSHDGLTGILNRWRFDQLADEEWKLAVKKSMPLSIVLIDIDHFKSYNDFYGHLMGDSCLKQVAGALKIFAHQHGCETARYGGEEFVMIAPETDSSKAGVLSEKLRACIEALSIPNKGSSTSQFITVSIGAAALIPTYLLSPRDLIEMADRALYQSKRTGRNKISVY